ncbi:MAG: M17 family peptidase N-terminal domain-containing protein, partial [Caulobacteraceae bacterium]
MKIEFVASDAEAGETFAVAVAAFEDGALPAAAEALDKATGGAVTRAMAGGRFTGALGQSLDLIAPHGVKAARILVVGAGTRDKLDARTIELAAAHAYQAVKASGVDTLLIQMPGAPP